MMRPLERNKALENKNTADKAPWLNAEEDAK
jgi:hypothetical protein